MKAWQAAIIFVVSLFLLLYAEEVAPVNPFVALFVELLSLGLGVFALSRHEGRTSVKVLGGLTVGFSAFALFVTIVMFPTFLILSALVHAANEKCFATSQAGETLKLGYWSVTVLGVRLGKYVNYEGSYYEAPKGKVVAVVKVRVTNDDDESHYLFASWSLIADNGISYPNIFVYNLEPVFGSVPDAIDYEPLSGLGSVPPGGSVVGDVLFLIPEGSVPSKLYVSITEGLRSCEGYVYLR